VYTDTKLSHRFIRFELLEDYEDEGKTMVDEFIRKCFLQPPNSNIGNLYLEETGTLQHKVQNDEDIKNNQGKVVSHAKGKHGKFYTINVVCNPQNNIDPPEITNETQEEVEISGGSKNSIGVMLLIKAHTMATDPQEQKLCKWANMFYEKLSKYVAENIKFFELRPYAYAN